MVEHIEIKDEDNSGNHTWGSGAGLGEWQDRAVLQWALRSSPGGNIMLMKRTADDNGLDYRGDPQTWLDVATFHNFHEAKIVFEALLRDAERAQL